MTTLTHFDLKRITFTALHPHNYAIWLYFLEFMEDFLRQILNKRQNKIQLSRIQGLERKV